ncbi:MAG: hypothetical protein ACLT0Y_05755 [Christensenellales bacterium]
MKRKIAAFTPKPKSPAQIPFAKRFVSACSEGSNTPPGKVQRGQVQKDHRNKGKRRTGQRINQVFTGIPAPTIECMTSGKVASVKSS